MPIWTPDPIEQVSVLTGLILLHCRETDGVPAYSGPVWISPATVAGTPAYSGPVTVRETTWLGEAGFSGPAPTIAYSILGTIEQIATLTGILRQSGGISGTIAQHTTLSGQLHALSRLNGTLTQHTSLSGQLHRSANIAGTLAQHTSLSGQLRRSARIAGTLAQHVDMSGRIWRSGNHIDGTIAQHTTLSGQLRITTYRIDGTLAQHTTMVGTLLYTPRPAPAYQAEIYINIFGVPDQKAFTVARVPDVYRPGSPMEYDWCRIRLEEDEIAPPVIYRDRPILMLRDLRAGRFRYRIIARNTSSGETLTQDYILLVHPKAEVPV